MIKKFCLALVLAFGLFSPAHAAGTMAFSLSQQFDSLGNPLNGGLLYFYQAGTTTPQNAYSDSALALPLPNPITLDTAGRVPQFFLADGTIKIRLTNSAGVTQVAADGIMVIGASSGTGTGSVVDATTVLAVGDLKVRYGTGTLSGFVRANGRTVGSATSGATERANADCQELFEYLWGADANLTVSTGRGASANADWVANKTIALPDWRGRALAFLDDMGNSAAGRLTSTYFGTSPIVLGAASAFLESRVLSTAHLPAYTPAGSVTVSSVSVTYPVRSAIASGGTDATRLSLGFASGVDSGTLAASASGTASFTGTAQGGTATPLSIIAPTMLATVYIKI